MSKYDKLIEEAVEIGAESFIGTLGEVPDRFRLIQEYAPGVFAGYGLMRHAVMQDRPAGKLDMKTKELVFTVLDTLAGDKTGAFNHGRAAIRLGLTPPELAEALSQVIMVGGIVTWNAVGYELMKACILEADAIAAADRLDQGRRPLENLPDGKDKGDPA